ncbi:response regulator receiver domain protein [Corynebacterium glucuronolyticum ATCC 51866]|uniref:Response regulator receiver domain protein n=2 Tax=Corynebacterium glucuronolyticum TaxID=39791 RepID=A0ABP2DV58_9CORY|nr:response regulator receiver domain protein [Corynebacterium glucuronolyticum ATCC 51866]
MVALQFVGRFREVVALQLFFRWGENSFLHGVGSLADVIFNIMARKDDVNVAVIDDHDVVRLGVVHILESVPKMNVVCAADNVPDVIECLEGLPRSSEEDAPAAVVLLDLRLSDGSMPAENVLELRQAGCKVIIFSSADRPFLLREALGAGVSALFNKSDDISHLPALIREVANGAAVFSSDYASVMYDDEHFSGVELSEKQLQVLRLIAKGMVVKQVARALNLTENTVNDYLKRIRQKYVLAGKNAGTQVQLQLCAMEDGYVAYPTDLVRG